MASLLFAVLGIYQIIPCDWGYYIDVRTPLYKYYEPLERITRGYIQVDSNE